MEKPIQILADMFRAMPVSSIVRIASRRKRTVGDHFISSKQLCIKTELPYSFTTCLTHPNGKHSVYLQPSKISEGSQRSKKVTTLPPQVTLSTFLTITLKNPVKVWYIEQKVKKGFRKTIRQNEPDCQRDMVQLPILTVKGCIETKEDTRPAPPKTLSEP